MTADLALPPRTRLVSMAAVISVALIFGLTYSLSAALIALDLAERGYGETMIGLNAAMHALGTLLVAPILPRLVGKIGPRRIVVISLGVAAVTLALFPASPLLWLWFPLRFVLGAASEVLFVLSETWTNSLAEEKTRARSMAAYMIAMSLGMALGPLILSIVGSQGALPYLIGTVLCIGALVLVAAPIVKAPHFEEPEVSNPLHYVALAPLAIATTVLIAALESSGLSFLALYAMGHGWDEAGAATLISAMMFGAIVCQVPIGYLGDVLDRRRLVIGLALVATIGAAAWPFVLHEAFIAYPLLFVWGGAFVGIYTIMLTVVGSRFHGSDLVGVYAVMGLSWGGGLLLGPALAGFAMDRLEHGLPIFAAAACLAYALFATASRSKA